MKKNGETRLKHWEKPGKSFYLYDKNGDKIYESEKEFTDHKQEYS